MSSPPDGTIYGYTLHKIISSDTNQDVKRTCIFPSNPRRHALESRQSASGEVWSHSLPVRGISTPVCVFVYMWKMCITEREKVMLYDILITF